MKSDGRFHKFSGNWSKKQEPQRRSGSGKEVMSNILSVEINETVAISALRKWESEKHKSWSMPAEGFKDHVATGGSLLGNDGKWGACGWAVLQLDFDEEMVPLSGICGSMEAECAVQRTIKRAEFTAFLCFLRKVSGPIKVHLDNKVRVAHVKAHRTKKEKEKMTKIERFVTEGNEKADELAKEEGAMLDEGFMAEVRAVTEN